MICSMHEWYSDQLDYKGTVQYGNQYTPKKSIKIELTKIDQRFSSI